MMKIAAHPRWRIWLLVPAAAIAVVGVLYWFGFASDPPRADMMPGGSSSSSSSVAPPLVPRARQPPPPNPTGRAEAASLPPPLHDGARRQIAPSESEARREIASRLLGHMEYGTLYREITAKDQPWSDQDLVALLHTVHRCTTARGMLELFQKERARRGGIEGPISARQSAAQNALLHACDGIPEDVVSNHGSQFSAELNRRHSEDPTYRMMTGVRTRATYGFALQAIDEAANYLGVDDPMIMISMGDFFQERLSDAGLAMEFRQQGLPLEHLRLAWTLVACDFAGGCGPESLAVRSSCLLDNVCDVQTWDESNQRLLRSETNRALAQWRQRITDSYRTGDWSWLLLDRLRRRHGG